jgi:hypothetical protein
VYGLVNSSRKKERRLPTDGLSTQLCVTICPALNTDVTEWWQFFPSKAMGMAFSDRLEGAQGILLSGESIRAPRAKRNPPPPPPDSSSPEASHVARHGRATVAGRKSPSRGDRPRLGLLVIWRAVAIARLGANEIHATFPTFE